MLSSRHVRLAAWAVTNLKNWPEVIRARQRNTPLAKISMRDGTRFSFPSNVPFIDGPFSPFFEIYAEHHYDHSEITVPCDGTVVDLGASVGIYSVYAASKLVPNGKVIAIEPVPDLARMVQANAATNGLHNITVLNRAVSKREGPTLLHLSERSMESSLFAGNGKMLSAAGITPQQVLRSAPRIDLLKMDCEGAEFVMLWEANAVDWATVQAVAMEYHLGFDTGYPDTTPKDAKNRLEQLGFTVLASAPTKAYPHMGHIYAARKSVQPARSPAKYPN